MGYLVAGGCAAAGRAGGATLDVLGCRGGAPAAIRRVARGSWLRLGAPARAAARRGARARASRGRGHGRPIRRGAGGRVPAGADGNGPTRGRSGRTAICGLTGPVAAGPGRPSGCWPGRGLPGRRRSCSGPPSRPKRAEPGERPAARRAGAAAERVGLGRSRPCGLSRLLSCCAPSCPPMGCRWTGTPRSRCSPGLSGRGRAGMPRRRRCARRGMARCCGTRPPG